jgi:RND family efflux transporter MFP subunit
VERDEVGVKFEPAPVPSTLSGVVARIYLDRGANVTLDTPVALVLDDSELLAKAEVPERYAGRVALGQDVRVAVEAWPDRSFRGTVSRVSPAVDPATRSAPIEVRITGQGEKLRSGMFAKLTLVMARRTGVLTIPTEAVMGVNADTVFVIENGKAFRRTIQTGLVTDRLTEVQKGLPPGALVATSGLFALQDGSAVEVLP